MTGRLALATLRARLPGFVATFVALFAASALVAACGLLLQTGLGGRVATERYAAAPVVVTASQSVHFTKGNGKHKAKPLTDHAWLDQSVVDRLRGHPGAAGAVSEVTFAATVLAASDRSGAAPGHRPSWGHGWSSAALAPLGLGSGHAPDAPGELVIDPRLAASAGLQVGQTARVQTAGGVAAYTVVGITSRALSHQASLFFSDPTARTLAGHPGQVYAVGLPHARIEDVPGLRAALAGTGAVVATGTSRGLVELTTAARARTTLISLSGVLGGTSLLVALLVVSGTFALSIGQRRRELALLRAVGATPRQVRRMIGREAVVIAVIAGLPGAAVGIPLATWLRSRFVAFDTVPSELGLVVGPLPLVAGLGVVVVGAWAAARVSARHAIRIQPVQALTEAAVEPTRPSPVRLAAGMLAVAVYAVLLAVLSHLHTDPAASPVTLLCAVVAVIAVALLGPLIARVSSELVGRPLELAFRRTGFVATANNRTNAQRIAAVITPITLGVSLAATILFSPTTIQHAATDQRDAGTRADAVVLPTGRGLPADVVSAARAAPGVTAAAAELGTTIRLGADKYPALGVSPTGAADVFDPKVRQGSLARLGEGGIALSALAAGHRDAHVGDRIAVTLGDGHTAGLTVAAIYARGLGFTDALLPLDLVLAHVDVPLASAVLVRGGTAATLQRAGPVEPGVRVVSPRDYRARVVAAQGDTALVGYLAMGLVLGFAAIAILNTLAMATTARSREFVTLRLSGMKRRQVRGMLRLETTAVVVTAVSLGALLGTCVLTAYTDGMAPGHSPYAPLAWCAAIVAVTLLLVATAVSLSSRQALRAGPAAGG